MLSVYWRVLSSKALYMYLQDKGTQILTSNICTYLKYIWQNDVFVKHPTLRLNTYYKEAARSTNTSEDNTTIWIFQANWNTIKDSHNLTYVQICQNKQTHQFVSSIVVSNVMSLAPLLVLQKRGLKTQLKTVSLRFQTIQLSAETDPTPSIVVFAFT